MAALARTRAHPDAIRLPNGELRIRRTVYEAWLADLEEPAA